MTIGAVSRITINWDISWILANIQGDEASKSILILKKQVLQSLKVRFKLLMILKKSLNKKTNCMLIG